MPNNRRPRKLPKPPKAERGQGEWTELTDEERERLDSIPVKDFSILHSIVPRLWRPAPLADSMLALEVISGDFKGVIFSYTNFEVMPLQLSGGFVPAKFNLRIWSKPSGFEHNEAFDNYTTEVLLAWLSYIATNDLKSITHAKPSGSIH